VEHRRPPTSSNGIALGHADDLTGRLVQVGADLAGLARRCGTDP
jgi:hypothetical protein